WITCEFRPNNNTKIALTNKYEVASFNDVFLHPFYWQVFNYLEKEAKLIVDCGAHCGHFSLLADICLQAKFNSSETEYILIEPNPYLIPLILANLKETSLGSRTTVKQALLGPKSGETQLWINHKNYLQTGLRQATESKPHTVSFLDLSSLVKGRVIDLMKIDIEGGEFNFIRENLDILKLTNLIFMELHQASEELQQEALALLESVGLKIVAEPVMANGQQLIILKREIV
ncbi:MAG: FkbM family methyltransferase, partial [Microcystaceae cyanobacterium]